MLAGFTHGESVGSGWGLGGETVGRRMPIRWESGAHQMGISNKYMQRRSACNDYGPGKGGGLGLGVWGQCDLVGDGLQWQAGLGGWYTLDLGPALPLLPQVIASNNHQWSQRCAAQWKRLKGVYGWFGQWVIYLAMYFTFSYKKLKSEPLITMSKSKNVKSVV